MEKISKIEIIVLLKNTELFQSLNDRELMILTDFCEFKRYETAEIIFSEGEAASHFYIVQTGEVMIIKDATDQHSIDVARFIHGESFGELDFFEKSLRSATAITRTKIQLLQFPKEGMTFEDLHLKHPKLSAKLLHDLLAEVAGRIRKTNQLISEKTPWISDLKRQVHTDKLTGLYNKRFLDEDFSDQFYNYGDCVSVLMIKPDRFKTINDRYGHSIGDKVLRMIAVFISSVLSESFIPVRYKSDEFVVVLPDTDFQSAYTFTETLFSIMTEMDLRHVTNRELQHLTISIGLATYPDHAQSPFELIDKAFENMLIAWNNGGDRVYG